MRQFIYKTEDKCWWEWEPQTHTCYNLVGGHHQYDQTPDDRICWANDWTDLDWQNSCVDQQWEQRPHCGWLDRDGHYFGCDYHEHSFAADVLWGSMRSAELKGIVHIFGPSMRDYYCERRLSREQASFLVNHGYYVREDNITQL